MLSAFIAKTKIVKLESLKKIIKSVISASKIKLLEINEQAISKGAEYIKALI